MRAAALLCLVALAGCSSSPATQDAGAGQCSVSLSGNVDDTGTTDGCPKYGYQADAGVAGGWVLDVDLSTTKVGRLRAVIDLGASPSSGTFTSAAIADWWAIGISASADCQFVASPGNDASFSLTLSVTQGDAGIESVHGTLSLQLPVQAGDGVDCGPRDVEYAEVTF